MIEALTLIFACQLAGEVTARVAGLPVPGPVLGLVALLVVLTARPALAARVRETALGMLSHLSLLFVPAGVGVMVHGGRLAGEWLPLGLAIAGSTILTLVVTVAVFVRVARLVGGEGAE